MQKSIYLFLLFIVSSSLQAQEQVYLSLDELISRTKGENVLIKKGQLNVELANAEVQKAKEWWLPNVFLGTNIHHLNGSALNSDGAIFPDVDRQTRWYGGEINLDLNIGKGIYDTKVKKLQAERVKLQNEVSSNAIVLNSIMSYYDLLKISAEKKIYEELISSKENLIGQLEVQVTSGLKLESELLLAKSISTRFKVQLLELNQRHQESITDLSLAANISDRSKVYVDFKDLQKIELMNVDEVGQTSFDNHPLYKMFLVQSEAEKKIDKGISSSLIIPRAGLRYSYGPFGLDYTDNQLTRGLQGYLGWNLPLGQLFFGGDSKISKSKSKINQLELEFQEETLSQKVVEYKNQLKDALAMIALTEEGKKYSNESLNQSNQRLGIGLGNLYEVLLAEEEFMQSQIQYLDALINHNIIQYKLWDALGNKI